MIISYKKYILRISNMSSKFIEFFKGSNVSDIVKNRTNESIQFNDIQFNENQNECLRDLEEIRGQVESRIGEKRNLMAEFDNLRIEKNTYDQEIVKNVLKLIKFKKEQINIIDQHIIDPNNDIENLEMEKKEYKEDIQNIENEYENELEDDLMRSI